MDIVRLLSEFGLTRQEAILYLCLLADGDRNGYELAKKTGISRSNTYTGLAGLVEKGAAWTLEGETVRYRAVPGGEFTANRLRRWTDLGKELLSLLPVPREKAGSYVTVKGGAAILDRMRNLAEGTRERLYLSLERSLIETILPELVSACERGCKMVILSDEEGCRLVSESCGSAVVHLSKPGRGQIRLIVDSLHVLTGEISETGESSCLYSDHRNLVELFKSAMKNEIRLAELEKSGRRATEDF